MALVSTTGLAVPAVATAAPVDTSSTAWRPSPSDHKPVPSSVVPKIRWAACGADFPAFQCLTVKVPRNYDKPSGATTSIALTQLPAVKPAK